MHRIIQAGVGASVAAAFLLSAGSAFAQTAPTFTFTPAAGTIATGNNVTVGTFMVSGANGTNVSSVPFTLTASGGGIPTNLTNCALYDNQNNNLGGTFNPNGTTYTYVFASPFATSAANTPLTLRCNVASTSPSGAAYTFAAGSPVYTTSVTPATPAGQLSVDFATVTTIPAGSANEALGIVSLDAAGSANPVVVTSLPVSITPNGTAISNLQNCSLRNTTNLTSALPATAAQNGSIMTFTLGTPITVNANNRVSLAVICDVAAVTPVGGSFTVSVTPSQIAATAGATGITPSIGTNASGAPLPTSGTITVASSGAGTGTGTDTGTGNPGVPNTGAGGNALASILMLALAGILAAAGSVYLGRRSA